ncbi:MAG TPA: hypothetical protein VKW09_06425 [bacterium]|nr:hypothetical protein [bacterium]
MLDRYSVEKLINAHGAEAVKQADQERLASAAAADRPKNRRVLSIAAKLRALAASGLRPTQAIAHQRES